VKPFNSVKVFGATMVMERLSLGEKVTAWIAAQPAGFELVDVVITQSSDSRFHLISIVVFFNETGKPAIDFVKPPAPTHDRDGVRLPADGTPQPNSPLSKRISFRSPT
jgi:hypothetical protein